MEGGVAPPARHHFEVAVEEHLVRHGRHERRTVLREPRGLGEARDADGRADPGVERLVRRAEVRRRHGALDALNI